MTVTAKLQRHAGDSYGYRFEANGKAVVYSTDSEHKLTEPGETAGFVEFFRNADVVIFDAMYSLAEATTVKADWGHSSNVVGVELCQMAGVRHLCLFHHEPANDDEAISRVLAETRRLEEITRTGAADARHRRLRRDGNRVVRLARGIGGHRAGGLAAFASSRFRCSSCSLRLIWLDPPGRDASNRRGSTRTR